MKKVLLALLLVASSLAGFSQKAHKPNPYKIGFGTGYYPNLKDPYIVDLKFYTRPGHAFEFIGYNLQTAWKLAMFFNPYTPISRDGKLRLVVGPGVHVGMWKERYKVNSWSSNPIVGVDAILGFEYRIPKTPIGLQIHYQPSYDLAGNNESFYGNEWAGGVVRIVF